ncbi:MAG: hypothetical protein IK078_00810, partial [Lachnospiraceae bacterium]|nr:hypothetical protein [Lachnospiraceae bacterium]
RTRMLYKIVVDGKEMTVRKQVKANNRETDNSVREEIIRHYLDTENATDVRILSATEEDE